MYVFFSCIVILLHLIIEYHTTQTRIARGSLAENRGGRKKIERYRSRSRTRVSLARAWCSLVCCATTDITFLRSCPRVYVRAGNRIIRRLRGEGADARMFSHIEHRLERENWCSRPLAILLPVKSRKRRVIRRASLLTLLRYVGVRTRGTYSLQPRRRRDCVTCARKTRNDVAPRRGCAVVACARLCLLARVVTACVVSWGERYDRAHTRSSHTLSRLHLFRREVGVAVRIRNPPAA